MSKELDEKRALRHTAEHVLHTAMQNLYPKLKKAMGPATEDGFYHDFDLDEKISEADFPKIEKEMQRLIDADLPLIQSFLSEEEAKKIFKDNPYKLDWIAQIIKRGEKISVYKMGDSDKDICSGPHAGSTGKVKAFKLLSVAGAYWHGDEKNKMLTRIYGTAFPSKKELDEYLYVLEEAKKRDHKKIGKEMGLWTFSEYVGQGLPLFTQKGALVRRIINEFVENLQSKQGIAQVWTPQIAKAELFKISGHYDKYKENMFNVRSNYSDEEFFLKPMNCPQHTQIYASEPRSYKDLPIRMADFAMLYRDEKPGELSGLTRSRSFSQDDCHIFCREDQIVTEMNNALDMTKEIMSAFGFKYKYRLSTRDPKHPEKYLGDDKTWEKATQLGEQILKDKKIDYFVGVGEAAFYAPKLDLIATDSLGREWQLSTLQIDFFMPERFKLTYTDENGKQARPVMLHRAILGSSERLMAILVEHHAGTLPVWLSPVQAIIIPISEKHIKYATSINRFIEAKEIRVKLDNRGETMQSKIRDAQIQKIPYMLIVGDREEKANEVSVRLRSGEDLKSMPIDKFIERISLDIANKA